MICLNISYADRTLQCPENNIDEDFVFVNVAVSRFLRNRDI